MQIHGMEQTNQVSHAKSTKVVILVDIENQTFLGFMPLHHGKEFLFALSHNMRQILGVHMNNYTVHSNDSCMCTINDSSQTVLQGEENMANSYIQHYSGQYIEIWFLFQHILQLHSNSQIHTFQYPITKIHLETRILLTSNKEEKYT